MENWMVDCLWHTMKFTFQQSAQGFQNLTHKDSFHYLLTSISLFFWAWSLAGESVCPFPSSDHSWPKQILTVCSPRCQLLSQRVEASKTATEICCGGFWRSFCFPEVGDSCAGATLSFLLRAWTQIGDQKLSRPFWHHGTKAKRTTESPASTPFSHQTHSLASCI